MIKRTIDILATIFMVLGSPTPIAFYWASLPEAWAFFKVPTTLIWLLVGILTSPIYAIGYLLWTIVDLATST